MFPITSSPAQAKRLFRECIACLAGAALFSIAAAVGTFVAYLLDLVPAFDGVEVSVFVVLSFLGPVVSAIVAWRIVRQAFGIAVYHTSRRPLRTVVVALYLITWSFGVPSVNRSQMATALGAYTTHAVPDAANDGPYVNLAFAVPLLPGVIVSYHEYQVTLLNGWGGWEIHWWYLIGNSRITRITVWVS